MKLTEAFGPICMAISPSSVMVIGAFALMSYGSQSSSAATLQTRLDGTGEDLINDCRAAQRSDDPYRLGYCFGFINSRIQRLDVDQVANLESLRRENEVALRIPNSDLASNVYCIIVSKNFVNDLYNDTASSSTSSEEVLDYILFKRIYKSECSV